MKKARFNPQKAVLSIGLQIQTPLDTPSETRVQNQPHCCQELDLCV
ncbi:hypothetical protein [Gloeocapsopsis sp. IPPAS B-1203]|nr:hypothetical protein [Gloeocapsopsis sp. IPPAS B-1203]